MNTSSTPLYKSFVLTFVLTLTLFQLSNAQTVHENMPITNGSVNAMVRDGNTLYLGGSFRGLGPYVPYGSSINMTTGQSDQDYVRPDDLVYAVVSDGAGGWFIAGDFTHVGGVARSHIARINADGSLNSWNPGADNQYNYTMAVSGNTLYVGGDFSTIAGQSRVGLVSFNITTGALNSWDPDINGPVTAIAVDGSTVYVGGEFSEAGGEYRDFLAAIDATSGSATTWNPYVYDEDAVSINKIIINGGIAYIGGKFTDLGYQPRNNIGAVSTISGNVTSWNPDADGIVHTMAFTTLVGGPFPGPTLFVGGEFSNIGGAAKYGIAALDLSAGNVTGWSGYSDIGNAVFSLVISNDLLYAGGYFEAYIGGEPRNNIVALDLINGDATSWNPSMESGVECLAVDGNGNIYAGGSFISVGWANRTYIAAIDATTGQVTPWAPQANNIVNELEFYNNTVYAGGNFTVVGGQNRNRIAGLNTTTGLATGFDPNPNTYAHIGDMVAANNLIYVGGNFTSMGGQSRNNLAALDPVTGNATTWNPDVSSQVDAIAVTSPTAYIGGYFTTIGGQSRYHIGGVDLTTGAPTTWNPGVGTNKNIYCLGVNGNNLYVGGNFNTIGGQTRNNIAAFDVTTGNLSSWDPNASNAVSSLAFGNNQVYAGGGFLTIGGQTRNYVAALDPVTGNASAWNPILNGGVGAINLNGNEVYMGGGFTTVNGLPHQYFTAIDDNFVVPVGLSNLTASIANDRLSVSWITNTESNNSHFDIEISNDGNEFTKVGTVLSKANNGFSSASLEYTYSVDMNKTLLMGLGGLLSLLLLPLFKGNKKKYIFGIAILLVSGIFIFNSGCKKIDTSNYYHGQKVMVRIVQVDKDGTKNISKVVVAKIVQ